MISIIAAVSDNGVIGSDNKLLWHISEDMRHFKTITMGHKIVMGRKTFESMGKPLPGRDNIVLSRQNIKIDGCKVVNSLEEALKTQSDEEIFIIGGSQIYSKAISLAHRLYITEVHCHYEGDAFFPDYDRNLFTEVSREDFPCGVNFPHPFSFVRLDRKF